MSSEEAERRKLFNESRLRLFGSTPDRVIVFLCECGAGDCRESVLLSAEDYAARVDAGESVVHADHASVA